jgi:hypothetical protein
MEKEISKYKLDLVGVQEVRWDSGGTEPAAENTFIYGKGNENDALGACFFFWYITRVVSAIKRVVFVSDTMSYILVKLKGRWCDIIVLNVRTPTEDKTDDMKDSFYEGTTMCIR